MDTSSVKATIDFGDEVRPEAVASPSTPPTRRQGSEPRQSLAGKLAYGGLLLFIVTYYIRPSDWLPLAGNFPFAKITAFFAVAGFALVLVERRGISDLPKEMFVLVLLLGHLCLAVPFAYWRGGSFEVISEFWKVVLVALSLPIAVNTRARLRKLLYVQAAAVSIMALLVATGVGGVVQTEAGKRAVGVLGGVFENPNDFAFNVALAFPLCFAFLLMTSKPSRKAPWALGLVLMGYTVMTTLSRAGLIALLVGAVMALWEFGAKGRRLYLIVIAAMVGAALLMGGQPGRYNDRLETIFDPDQDPTGSAQERRDLFYRSIDVTLEHPILGVGPGNFQEATLMWRETHNTYTQLSSEGGIPALLFFLVILRLAFVRIRRTQKLVPRKSELSLLASALRASLAAFVVGALFSSVAYQFFPYYLIGFASAMHRIALAEQEQQSSQTLAEGRSPLNGAESRALKVLGLPAEVEEEELGVRKAGD